MKKSLKKTINHLENFVGHEIIRTKPTTTDIGNWYYTDEPVFLLALHRMDV